MWLDIYGVLGLAQDLQQIVAGQEVEAGKLLPLVLQVILQRLLDVLQLAFYVSKALQHTRCSTRLKESDNSAGTSKSLVASELHHENMTKQHL